MVISNYDPGQDLGSINFSNMIGAPLLAGVEAHNQSALATVNYIKSVGFYPDTEDSDGNLIPGKPVYVSFRYPKMVAPYQAAGQGQITQLKLIGSYSYTLTGSLAGSIVNLVPIVVTSSGTGSGAEIIANFTQDNDLITVNSLQLVIPGNGYTDATVGVEINGNTLNLSTEFTVTTNNAIAIPAQFQDMEFETPILTLVPITNLSIDSIRINFNAKINSMEYKHVADNLKLAGSFEYGRNKKSNINLKISASYQRSSRSGHKIDKTYQLGVEVIASQSELPAGMERIFDILEEQIVSQPVI